MQINEVTIFKLIFFAVCIVVITVLAVLLWNLSPGGYSCQTLISEPGIVSSTIAEKCPQGYYTNYGKFNDVKKGMRCCVKYEESR